MTDTQLAPVLRHVRRLAGLPAAEDPADSQLLERFALRRDPEAFEMLVRRHGPLVWRVCRRFLHHADAEDAFQATFLVLARRAGAVRRPESLAAFLHGIACRIAQRARADAGRRQQREKQVVSPVAADPAREAAWRELGQIVEEEVRGLPEKYRAPLLLCYWEGRTNEEAAHLLGWPAGTVKTRLAKARQLLQGRLARRGVALPGGVVVLLLAPEGAKAAVPAALMATAAGVGGAATAEVAALAEAGLRGVAGLRMKVGMALLLVAGAVAAGAGALARPGPGAGRPEATAGTAERPKPGAEGPARTDSYGDPLPEGAVFRFGSVRLRHGTRIRTSALSPDGKLLATAGDESVAVWDLAGGKVVRRFGGDFRYGFCCPGLAFSPDGKRLAYVHNDNFACVWDLSTGREVHRFEGNRCGNPVCRFTPDGKELVLTKREQMIFWDLASGKETRSFPAPHASLLSPDTRTYVEVKEGQAVVLGDARTGKETARFTAGAAESGLQNGVAFRPDGKALAVLDRDKEVQVRDLAGKVQVSFPLPARARKPKSERYWEYRIGFSADGKTLLLGTETGMIFRWDLAAGKELPPLQKHRRAVAGFHTLADGRTLVSTGADGAIRRWDLKSGRELPGPEGYWGRTHAARSPDGRRVAVGDEYGRLDLWDAASGKRLRTLRREGPEVTRLLFAPDGRSLAVGQAGPAVRLYAIPSGKEGKVLAWEEKSDRASVRTLLFSPDGRSLIAGDYHSDMRRWDVVTGKLLWRGRYEAAAALSPDGNIVAAALGGPHLTFLEAATGKVRRKVRLNAGYGDDYFNVVEAVAYSPDGRLLAVALCDGHVALCDARGGSEVRRFRAVDPPRGIPRQMLLQVRAVAGNQVRSLAFSPDGKWLLTGGSDAAVRVWEVVTGKQVWRRDGHQGAVSAVAFGPDGRTALSCGGDAQAYLWDLRPGARPGRQPPLERLWAGLAATEPATAYRAVWALSEAPGASRFLGEKIRPVPEVDGARVAKWIADLDSDRFAVRHAADRALREAGRRAEPALKEALKKAPSLEVRRRLEGLLGALSRGPTPAELRQQRAVQALELAGTPEARAQLQRWAGGATEARLTEDARAALGRLARRERLRAGGP